jgi:hypothetical protein
MRRSIDKCFFVNRFFCDFSSLDRNCTDCPDSKTCCSHVHNCEPWHCSVYNRYMEKKNESKK